MYVLELPRVFFSALSKLNPDPCNPNPNPYPNPKVFAWFMCFGKIWVALLGNTLGRFAWKKI